MKININKKILAGFFAILFSLAVLPSLTMALADDFSLVRSIRFIPAATITSFTPFDGSTFVLSNFIQKKSLSNFRIDVSNGNYVVNFFATISGQYGPKASSIATITIRNQVNENVACSPFSEQEIFCTGGQMTVTIMANGRRWSGTLDSYTFKMVADGTGEEDGNLGFSHAQILGYKNGYNNGNPVVTIDLKVKSFSFGYSRNSAPAIVSFQLSGGNVEPINQPSLIGLKSTNLVWDPGSFQDKNNGGSGRISSTLGFYGTVSLNLQGTFTSGSKTYTVRNEIYMNLNNLQFSDCPIFQQGHILCYIRSGYIHTYIPLSRDTTFWKAPIKLFVLEIIGNKATLTAGQNSASDVLKVSDMDVSNLRFRN